jgi:hypothetical protein
MAISLKQRRWILGGALLLTVAAAAFENQNEQDTDVVQADADRKNRSFRRFDPHSNTVNVASASSPEIFIDQLKRAPLPGKVKDMFAAKSWYIPPPVSKVRPKPVAPSLPFVYMGKMMQQGEKSSVFLAKQDRIYIVSEGDAVDMSYRVDSIAPPLMTLTYLPLDIKQTMQIGETN